MESVRDKILSSREARYKYIQDKLTGSNVLVSLRANIPGNDKNIQEAYMLCGLFYNLITKGSSEQKFIDTDDGPIYFFLFEKRNGKDIKKTMVGIEDTHELGRFVDIDVYQKNYNFSRDKKRKCIICDDLAFNCIVSKKHTVEEVLDVITKRVDEYFHKEIQNIIKESIKLELDLDPKFGLVTPKTNGSHKDMSYNLMLKAANSIIPYFMMMFDAARSSNDIGDIFPTIRKIGIQAENRMFEVTENINAYKGLIFDLGLFTSAFSYLLYHPKETWNIFDLMGYMVGDILDEFDRTSNSFGHEAFEKYGILGARGEAKFGFPHVQKALEYLRDFSVQKRTETLAYLISEIEDTNLLKRSGTYEKYLENKNMFKPLRKYDKVLLKVLDEYCINNNLSFGGSADLLITTIFMKKLNIFYKSYN